MTYATRSLAKVTTCVVCVYMCLRPTANVFVVQHDHQRHSFSARSHQMNKSSKKQMGEEKEWGLVSVNTGLWWFSHFNGLVNKLGRRSVNLGPKPCQVLNTQAACRLSALSLSILGSARVPPLSTGCPQLALGKLNPFQRYLITSGPPTVKFILRAAAFLHTSHLALGKIERGAMHRDHIYTGTRARLLRSQKTYTIYQSCLALFFVVF